jgi:uncharacterized protein (DUF1330 family)
VAVYLIADIRIINQQRYDEYRAVMRGAVRAHGGRYLVRTGQVRVVEGNWVPPRIVLIEFPDRAAAQAFHVSGEFAKARDICANAAMVDMVLAEGVDPAPGPLRASGEMFYVISDIKVINPERFAEYRRSAAVDLAKLGGRYLVRDGRFEIIAGGWQPTMLSVVEYPSRASIDARLASDEYERSRVLRANAAMVDRIVVEGWPQGKPLE